MLWSHPRCLAVVRAHCLRRASTCCTLMRSKFDPHANNPVSIPEKGSIPPHKHYPWSDLYAENPWAERRSRLVDALLATGPLDIVGFQEVLHGQLLDLAALLGPGYGHVGVGRNDGKERGEYAPIFWNKDKFELVRWKTIWLSPTPDEPGSKGWDAVSAPVYMRQGRPRGRALIIGLDKDRNDSDSLSDLGRQAGTGPCGEHPLRPPGCPSSRRVKPGHPGSRQTMGGAIRRPKWSGEGRSRPGHPHRRLQ